jgi:hypothetical protein
MTQKSRIIPAEPSAAQIERGLRAGIPGGSEASHWFLPHETPQGAANVREVVRRIYLAMIECGPEVSEEPVLVVEKEPDYWSRGHFYEGSDAYINPLKVLKLPVGTKLYTAPQPQQDAK